MLKYIFFDFDGVLHNTFEVHLREIRNFSGSDLTEQEYRDLHNGNFFGHEQEKLKNMDWIKYRDHVKDHITGLKTEDTMKMVIRELCNRYGMTIVSSSGKSIITRYLENNDLEKCFSDILGAEFHHSKEEKCKYLLEQYNLRPEEVVFVTDTLGDILEARAVGIESIAVTFGFHDRETLEKGEPRAIVGSPEELLLLIKSL